ncbi:MAG: Fic family protein [Candidatus Thiodiazotropha sp. LLP2]
MTDRYDISGTPEGQFQPGSADQVLLNKLGVTDTNEMDDIELVLLEELQTKLLDEVEADQRITVADLSAWHRAWLGSVYKWAGEFRSVTMSKDGFPFAAAHLIPKLMADFDKAFLASYTPCDGFTESQLIEALAVCHIELIIVHPFREGNGRLARVLATIMALQAGMPLLDFTYISENQDLYISAIHKGHAGDYEPMKLIFYEVLKASMLED